LKKALILAYDFPPFNSIGAQRPFSWYKYFSDLGIEPIVVTRHWDREITGPDDCNLPTVNTSVTTEQTDFGTLIRAPFFPSLRDRLISKTDVPTVLFRKVLSVWQLLTEHFLESSDNKTPIYRAAREYLKKNKVDVIIACGEPFVLFRYASELSKEFGIPWAGDYRDGWSTNYRWDDAKLYGLIQRSVQQRVEKRVTTTASLLTTAAPSFSKRIATLTGRKEQNIPVVYNGYFEDLFEGLEDVPEKETFHIVHAGTLYYFQRVETFLNGLNLFLKENPKADITTTFFGLNFYPAQIDRIKASAGNANVKFTDKIPHKKMLEELASSHLQLLVATPEKHQIYGKVFDYLASGRPTLMVENDQGPLEWILSHQENAFAASTPEQVATYIKELYSDREKTKRLPRSENQFSRRKQTERFANLILEVLNKNEK
jgi:glycosyltransferase involved in cell wall biosynthesis